MLLVKTGKDFVNVSRIMRNTLLIWSNTFNSLFFAERKNKSWLHSASFLIDELIKMHDLIVSFTFTKTATFHEVGKMVSLSQFVNKLKGLFCIFVQSESIHIKEVFRAYNNVWLLRWVNNISRVICHYATHEFKESISDLKMIKQIFFIRIQKLHVECQVDMLQHLLIWYHLNMFCSFDKSLLQNFVLSEWHAWNLTLRQAVLGHYNNSFVKVNFYNFTFKIILLENSVWFYSYYVRKRCIQDICHL